MSITWVLVANDSGARLYESEGPGKEIKSIKQFAHPAGRKKDQEINSDKPGRSFDSFGGGRHSMDPEVRTHVHEEEVFVNQLAKFLEKEFSNHHFQKLNLVAPPRFLGELRKEISEGLKKTISEELNKDFPDYISDHDLVGILRKDLNL